MTMRWPHGTGSLGSPLIEPYRIDIPYDNPRGWHPLDSDKEYVVEPIRQEARGNVINITKLSVKPPKKKSQVGRSSLDGSHLVKPERFNGQDRNHVVNDPQGPALVVDLRQALRGKVGEITEEVIKLWRDLVKPKDHYGRLDRAGRILLLRTLADKDAQIDAVLHRFPYFKDQAAVNALIEATTSLTGTRPSVVLNETPSVEKPDIICMRDPDAQGLGGAHGAFNNRLVTLGNNFDLNGDFISDGTIQDIHVIFDPALEKKFPDSKPVVGAYCIPQGAEEAYWGAVGVDRLVLFAKARALADQDKAKKRRS